MRFILWSLLAAFLIIVGLWPAAAAPVVLASAGLTVVVAKIPGLLLLVAAVAYFRRKPARPATT